MMEEKFIINEMQVFEYSHLFINFDLDEGDMDRQASAAGKKMQQHSSQSESQEFSSPSAGHSVITKDKGPTQ